MDKNELSKVKEIVNSIMGIDITSLDPEKKFNSIPEWDSFNNLMLISKFQDEFRIEFTAVEIENTQRVKDLFSLIENKIKSN